MAWYVHKRYGAAINGGYAEYACGWQLQIGMAAIVSKNICTARDLNDTWSRSSVALTDNISVSMRAVTNAGAMEGN